MQKGVNVSEIENKKVVTENKIEELDKKLEDLPNVREKLVSKYRLEKEVQLVKNLKKDYTKEREEENICFFKKSDGEIPKHNNVDKNSKSLLTNALLDQINSFQKRR